LFDPSRRVLKQIRQGFGIADIVRADHDANDFQGRFIIKKRDGKKLSEWFGKAEQSGVSELARFVKGLREDEAAIQAAMEYEWSKDQASYCTSYVGSDACSSNPASQRFRF
jgi:hypothetical protein